MSCNVIFVAITSSLKRPLKFYQLTKECRLSQKFIINDKLLEHIIVYFNLFHMSYWWTNFLNALLVIKSKLPSLLVEFWKSFSIRKIVIYLSMFIVFSFMSSHEFEFLFYQNLVSLFIRYHIWKMKIICRFLFCDFCRW